MAEKWRTIVALFLVAVILSACGASTGSTAVSSDTSTTASTEDVGESNGESSGSVQAPPGFEDLNAGQLADGLIPELADIPLPSVAAFGPGAAFSADQDPRETALQMAFFLEAPADIAKFYIEELPRQGYTISGQPGTVEQVDEMVAAGSASFALQFDGPDGVPLQLNISTTLNGVETTMNINRFRNPSGG